MAAQDSEINAGVAPANNVLTPGADPYPKLKTETYAMFGGINAKVSPYVNQPHEFRDILNMDFFFPGALNKRPGSTLYCGQTIFGTVSSGVEFQRLNGASYIIAASNTNLYSVTPSSFSAVVTGLRTVQQADFTVMADRLFVGTGDTYLKFDGSNGYLYSLPPGFTGTWGVTWAAGGSLTNGNTAIFVCAYGYVNERGYGGPTSNGITITVPGTTVSGGSIINSILYYGMTQPVPGTSGSYGITAIQLWRSTVGGVDLFGTTLAASGSVTATDSGFPLGSSLAIPHVWMTMAPKYLEIYNNQLFMAGFSQYPSRVYWSEIGEPEAVQPQFYAEFRTNDGDRITGLKSYGGALVVGKARSLHRIIGDNPSNFAIQEISAEYGSISNQAMVVFENVLWCIDQKGIVQYNGANVEVISDPVEPYWLQMNVGAAQDFAVGAHYKQLGQVWFSFPSNAPASGSTAVTTNNATVLVYDYGQRAWTRHSGVNPSCFFIAQGDQGFKTLFFGNYSGGLSYFGQSYMSDNGTAFTCVPFTKWLAPAGQTTESLYRRLWLDVDPIIGITQNISVQMFSNYVTATIAYTGTIPATTFQSRVDFGLSARTLACQFAYASATLPFKINAYSLESRYQRSV